MTDDERRAISGADELLMVLEHDTESPCPPYPLEGALNGLQRCGAVRQFKRHHLDQYFGVGFTHTGDATRFQSLAKSTEILDDAVVNQMDRTIRRTVRVCVGLSDAPMGGPAGVSDAFATIDPVGKNAL